VKTFEVEPGDFGLKRAATLDYLRGGDAEMNARIISEVLRGERRDAARALVIVNAAAALFVGGAAEDLPQAARLAAQSIDTGAAQDKLRRLVEATNHGQRQK
jgi:anthranilate phosphoribosyltransferase